MLTKPNKCEYCGKVIYTKTIGYTHSGEPIIQALHKYDYPMFIWPATLFDTEVLVKDHEICKCTSDLKAVMDKQKAEFTEKLTAVENSVMKAHTSISAILSGLVVLTVVLLFCATWFWFQ